MSKERIVLDYGDYIIRERDLDLVKGRNSGWLNDTLIGFYFQYLSEQSKREGGGEGPSCNLIGPEITQLLKLIPNEEVGSSGIFDSVIESLKSFEYTFFPVNDATDPEAQGGGTHWSLLIYSKGDNAFIHFDSYGNSNDKHAHVIMEKLGPHTGNNSKGNPQFLTSKNCQPQTNTYDCGCHVLKNAEMIMAYLSKKRKGDVSLLQNDTPTAGPEAAAEMRKELVQLIERLAKENS